MRLRTKVQMALLAVVLAFGIGVLTPVTGSVWLAVAIMVATSFLIGMLSIGLTWLFEMLDELEGR